MGWFARPSGLTISTVAGTDSVAHGIGGGYPGDQSSRPSIRTCFLALRDLSSDLARMVIDPALRHDLGAMEAARRRAGRRAVVESVSVSGAAVRSAGRQGGRHAITVDFSGVAATYELDSAGRGSGRQEAAPYPRSLDLQPAGGGRVQQARRRPRRGLPQLWSSIAVDESGRCRLSGTEVILGNRDWVLSEVARRAQWDSP